MKWIEKEARNFYRDKERIRISEINWRYHKPIIKKKLESIVKQAKANGIEFYIDDYADEPIGSGFDGMNLVFKERLTGNMIKEKNRKYTHYKRHIQKGAALEITYNAIGIVMISLSPSKSEDSLASQNPIILFEAYDAGKITDEIIVRSVKSLIRFHRRTGVLHRTTFKDKWVVRWLRIRMFFLEYDTNEQKLKKYSDLYFPVWALVIAVLTLIVTYLASNFNH